jgi:hypothetical protein
VSNVVDKLIGAIDRAVSGNPREYTMAETMAAIAADCEKDLVSAEDLKAMRDFQRQHEAFGQTVMDHTDTKARADWLKQNNDATAKMLAGTFDPERDLFSREDFEQDYRLRLEAARRAQRGITQQCLPIAEKAANNFAKAAEKIAAALQTDEQAQCKKFAVRFEPSTLVNRIRECSRTAVGFVAGCKANSYSNHSPRAVCPFLKI